MPKPKPVSKTDTVTIESAGGDTFVITATVYEYNDDPPGLATAALAKLRSNGTKNGGKIK